MLPRARNELNAPTMAVLVVSLVFAVLALIGAVVPAGLISRLDVWIALLGYVVLAVGVAAKM